VPVSPAPPVNENYVIHDTFNSC